jgi:PAS domain S-box-containing protein
MDEGFCIVDMLYDPDGKAVDYRFVEINPAFEKQTGLQQALGKTIREMVPDNEAYWFEIYGKVALTGEALRFQNPAQGLQKYYDVFAFRLGDEESRRVAILFNDISERKRAAEELQRYSSELVKSNKELQDALANIKTLGSMLPICASCKKIRDDKGYWSQVETYISAHTETIFTSGICPECEKKMYEELEKLKKEMT